MKKNSIAIRKLNELMNSYRFNKIVSIDGNGTVNLEFDNKLCSVDCYGRCEWGPSKEIDHMKDIAKNICNIAPEFRDEFMDNELVNSAKKAMEEKLKAARNKGRGGWWSDDCKAESLKEMLKEHVEKGDMRDVMNIAAMIYYRESAGIGEQ